MIKEKIKTLINIEQLKKHTDSFYNDFLKIDLLSKTTLKNISLYVLTLISFIIGFLGDSITLSYIGRISFSILIAFYFLISISTFCTKGVKIENNKLKFKDFNNVAILTFLFIKNLTLLAFFIFSGWWIFTVLWVFIPINDFFAKKYK